MEEIVKFSVNNWSAGKDYPEDFPFCLEGAESPFEHNDWCIENKVCVVLSFIDMSVNFCITATKDWVKKNCPCILGSKFEYVSDASEDKWGRPFREYCPENFGCIGYDEDNEDYFEWYDDECEED